ncbi:hypothetical protein [Polaromonas sp. A23]|uniref:hypothetical protein n=1 Tax=Polaromonas sp. A23 TaxID=1944133 RepID=UPI0009846DB6|nr:hypothetical protein [Polaromonas sp. A23]OOG45125.1 hypothetical protein B0B52_05165 [Polaromonas sp. A23]
MKKPVLAALGLGAACVACCTLPLGFTLLGGSAMAGGLAALFDWSSNPLAAAAAAAVIATAAVGLTVWRMRRNRRAACAAPVEGSHCATSPQAGACGCGPNT